MEARKGKGKYINKLKESFLNDENRVVKILAIQAMMLPMRPSVPLYFPPVLQQDPAMLVSIIVFYFK